MAEISNTTLAILVFAALVIVVAGTALNFMSLGPGLTGFATSDTGNVSLSIGSNLAIQVDPNNNTINFGTCGPRPGSSYYCATNDSIICDNTTLGTGNCSLDTTAQQWIGVNNVGNVNASINITDNECAPSNLIGGTSPEFSYMTTLCNGTGVSGWTNFTSGAQQNNVCNNLEGGAGRLRLFVRVVIPSNAIGGNGAGCTDNRSTVTFSAVAS
jgi:hypothetical protein